MCSFYGMKPDEVMEMDADEANMLLKGIAVIEAQDMLRAMKVADFPNMQQSDRQSLHREIYSRAYPAIERKPITLDKLNEVLKRGR